MNRSRSKDWRDTDIGWRGFFQGYATAEKDAINRSRDRVGYVVDNIRGAIKAGKTDEEMLRLLDRINVSHVA